jgi:hypothetical protein
MVQHASYLALASARGRSHRRSLFFSLPFLFLLRGLNSRVRRLPRMYIALSISRKSERGESFRFTSALMNITSHDLHAHFVSLCVAKIFAY